MQLSTLVKSAAAAALLLSAAPAAAQSGGDVRCLLVANLFAKSAKDAKARNAAEAAKYYYLGRINGRMNAQQLKSQALAASKTVNAKNAGQVMNGCVQQIAAASNSLQSVMRQLAPAK
jgi:hypothetical protein